MSEELRLSFGALGDSFSKQLKRQGFRFDAKAVKRFENSRYCITQLMFDGFLSDNERNKAEKKLFNKIRQHVIHNNHDTKDKAEPK